MVVAETWSIGRTGAPFTPAFTLLTEFTQGLLVCRCCHGRLRLAGSPRCLSRKTPCLHASCLRRVMVAFTRSFVLVLAVIAALLAPGAIGPGGLLATSVPASAAPPSDEDLGKTGRSSAPPRRSGSHRASRSRTSRVLRTVAGTTGNVLTADLTTDSLSLDVRDTPATLSPATTPRARS